MSSVTYACRDGGGGVDGASANCRCRCRCGDVPSGYCCGAPSGYYSRAGPFGDCRSVRPLPFQQRKKSSKGRALWLFLVSWCLLLPGCGLSTRGILMHGDGMGALPYGRATAPSEHRARFVDKHLRAEVLYQVDALPYGRATAALLGTRRSSLHSRYPLTADKDVRAPLRASASVFAATRLIASTTASGHVKGIWWPVFSRTTNSAWGSASYRRCAFSFAGTIRSESPVTITTGARMPE